MKKKKTLRITNLERRIITSSPVRFIIRKSKRIILPGMDGIPLFDVSRFFFRQLNTVGINERAAAISFNFLMAIPATMIFLFTLVPYLPISKQFTQELLILAKDLTPNYSTYQVVRDFLNDFLNTPRTGLLSFGFLLVIYYSSNAMMGIMQSFDRSLVSLKKRNFLQSRWIAIKLTFIFLILIIAAVLVLITQGKILEWVLGQLNADSPAVRILVKGLRWIIILALFFFSIAFIYKYAPSVHKRWKLNSPGTTLATFLIIVSTFAFSFWVNNFGNFNKVYGSIGTVMILMLLIYFSSLALLIGFELNVSLTYLKIKAEERMRLEEKAGLN